MDSPRDFLPYLWAIREPYQLSWTRQRMSKEVSKTDDS